MRVISGKYKGKKLEGFLVEGTRPTMDRVKESFFAMIQNDLFDTCCLDLFAGSGSLGIEALSAGARVCYFVDNSPTILPILKRNLENIKEAHLLFMHYEKALEKFFQEKILFDIIFLDPPYHKHLLTFVLDKISSYGLLKKGGKIICEFEEEDVISDFFVEVKSKDYGSKKIRIYTI